MPASQPGVASVDATGDWIGALPTLPLAFRLRPVAGGAYRVALDSPASGVFDFRATAAVRGETLSIEMPAIGARYVATWRAADARWIGRFLQNGATTPMVLSRGQLPPIETIDALDGTWDGLEPGARLPGLLLRFRTAAGHGTSGTLDLPDLNSRNAYASRLHRDGDRVSMGFEALGARLEGRLSSDGKTIDGRFSAFGATTPVTLTRRPPT